MVSFRLARLGACLTALILFTFILTPAPAAQSVTGRLTGQHAAAIPGAWQRPGTLHKVVLPAGDPRLETLRAAGVILRAWDYGTSSVLVVDSRRIRNLQAAGYPVRDEYDLVAINGWLLDGLKPETTLARLHPAERFPERPDSSRGNAHSLIAGSGLYLVKFEAPIRDEWLDALTGTGARIVQSMPMHAYVVHADAAVVGELSSFGETHPAVQYVGEWQPAFRMAPQVREAAAVAGGVPMPVTIQLVDGPGIREAVAFISELATHVAYHRRVGPYVNLAVDLDPAVFRTLASWPEVFAIEPRGTPQRNDERQGQIVAGNISGSGPNGTGYLAWLASEGFAAGQFDSFSVNVVDDASWLGGHPDLELSRVDFSQDPTGQGALLSGHGFLNAQILAGRNSGTGSTVEDAQGYNYGLGIAPWAHVGSTSIYGPAGASITSWESSAYSFGARISSNGWSYIDQNQNPIPAYDSSSQEVDALTRDARSSQPGNQEYLIISSAGNDGPSGNTISTPSTAKNIITVGASEGVRPLFTDGCGVGVSGADDLADMIDFSSHGPVNSSGGDGRYKPEIVAPGTHIQAGIPQGGYDGSGVCNPLFPPGSTLYSWSSGTSHAVPAVAGGAALVRQDFLNRGFSAPSPALVKAVLLNSTRYLTGAFAADTLPSNSQGMGLMDLGMAFDAESKMVIDQTEVLSSAGSSHVLTGQVADPGAPFRVTLVWTDAPGPTTGAPWVNDLDLEVVVGGNTYRGNVFSGGTSIAGGNADFRNNNESVFLPAGTSGSFSVTVNASTIPGDGVPGNGDGTDQDFALIIYNGTKPGGGPIAAFNSTPTAGLVPLTVEFTNLTSGGDDTWDWTFGDGGSSTEEHPSYTYTSSGDYTVSLMVSGSTGSDTMTKTAYITVSDPPPPGVSDGSFEAQALGATPMSPWEVFFGGGHFVNPTSVSTDNGMPSDGSQWVEIAGDSTNAATPPSNPGGLTLPPQGAAGVAQTFTIPAGDTTLKFSAAFVNNEGLNQAFFNDWMSIELTDGSVNYNVFYKDTFSPTPVVSTKWASPMTSVEEVSVDLLGMFPASTLATQFTLTASIGNGSDNFQPSKGYLDDVRLEAPVGAPDAQFSGTPISGTRPLAVAFDNESSGGATSWFWTFGDNKSSTAQNPSHTYTVAGTYTVTLTATNASGSDAETKVGYITVNHPPPIANFLGSPTTGTLPLLVKFIDISGGGPTSSWAWDFGDSGTSTAQSPTHTYTTAGTYAVTLVSTGPGGSGSETKVGFVTVKDPVLHSLLDGSFENQVPGAAPSGQWEVLSGAAHVVHPNGQSADGEWPSAGSQWLELAADGTDDAMPPSNPGGKGALPLGAHSVAQTFRSPAGLNHRLFFDAAFLRNGAPSSAATNDWMSVDITDGTTTANLYYADSFTPTPATSAIYGLPMTDFSTVVVNLRTLFPKSTTHTEFTLLLSVGNGGDAANSSKGYVDRVRLMQTQRPGAHGSALK